MPDLADHATEHPPNEAADAAASRTSDTHLVSLQTLLQARLNGASGDLATEKISHHGQSYVVKYRRRGYARHVRSWLVSAGCAILFCRFVRPARLRAGDIAHEARRLRQLYGQGVRVPRVFLQTADYLVLEFCGEDLTRRLQAASPAEKRVLLGRVFDELAAFHRGGHWHGGAQVRNLTMSGGRSGQIHRIDFEEAAGEALPLALMQAYDLILTLHSVVDHLADGDDGASGTSGTNATGGTNGVAQGLSLLQGYFRQAPSAEVAQALRRLARVTDGLLGLEPMLRRQAQKHKDIRRSLALARLLRAFRLGQP